MDPAQKAPSFKPLKSLLPAGKAGAEKDKKGAGSGLLSFTAGGAHVQMPVFSRNAAKAPLLAKIKSLKPHELAFAGAGLAVLLMAPLLDFLVSTPRDSVSLSKGFNSTGAMFGEAGDAAEVGMNGIARGGAVAGGKEESLITPLDQPDPLNLVMVREGQRDKAPAKVEASSSEPASEAPKLSKDSWKEAITAAKAGVKQAVSRSPGLPRPSAKLEGQLRGLAALQAGGSGGAATAAALRLDAPASSKGLVGAPSQASSLSRVSVTPGFKGVAAGSLVAGGLRPNGTGGGSAATSLLDQAASSSGNTNFFGLKGGGLPDGAVNANPAVNSQKDAKTSSTPQTENLALLQKKMEMQKALDLKYAKLQYDQVDRKKMFEQVATQTAFQTASQAALKLLDKALNPNGQQQGQGQGQGQGQAQGAGQGAGVVSSVASSGPPAFTSSAADSRLGYPVTITDASGTRITAYSSIQPTDSGVPPGASVTDSSGATLRTYFSSGGGYVDNQTGKVYLPNLDEGGMRALDASAPGLTSTGYDPITQTHYNLAGQPIDSLRGTPNASPTSLP